MVKLLREMKTMGTGIVIQWNNMLIPSLLNYVERYGPSFLTLLLLVIVGVVLSLRIDKLFLPDQELYPECTSYHKQLAPCLVKSYIRMVEYSNVKKIMY